MWAVAVDPLHTLTYVPLPFCCLLWLAFQSLLEARAIEVGFGKAESTLVVAALSFVIFVVAYPLGRLDDK